MIELLEVSLIKRVGITYFMGVNNYFESYPHILWVTVLISELNAVLDQGRTINIGAVLFFY